MEIVKEFARRIAEKIGMEVPSNWKSMDEIQVARRFLDGINRYLYQKKSELGATEVNGEEFHYFSAFHKYWESAHKDILNLRVSEEQTRIAAEALQQAVSIYGVRLLERPLPTLGLLPEQVAQVRFLTANQDFRKPPENQFEKYLDDKEQFAAETVASDPAAYLNFMNFTKLSQTEKGLDFARNAAGFLLKNNITAYEIAQFCGNDAAKVRKILVTAENTDYGSKKANMFIRDMIAWRVWPDLNNIDAIDVASDTNTMKIALRARILVSEIPLLSSLLDIFCYQYEYVNEMAALAWRQVWKDWVALPGSHAPVSPCLMDFLIYRVGKDYCKDILVKYKCESGHDFYYFYARKRICSICTEQKKVQPEERLLPCQIPSSELPRKGGNLLLNDKNLLFKFNGKCLFEDTCLPRSASFVKYEPPRSISIKGETGWTSAYAEEGVGGGGLMA